MASASKVAAPLADVGALKRIGETVRGRLDADPAAYRVPVEGLEIYGVANFFTAMECARLIGIIDSVARPSEVFYAPDYNDHRTSYSGNVDPNDPFVRMLERRIDDLLGMPHQLGETMQGQRYTVGQQFKAHHDFFHTTESYWLTERKRGGQRSWTAMGYLNKVEEGGSTDFTKVSLSVPPQPGAMLIWNNMRPDGTPNPLALHAGTPVTRGAKYVITKWYRARRWS